MLSRLLVSLIVISASLHISAYAEVPYCPKFLGIDLKLLDKTPEVRELQLFLNSNPATVVALYGLGSSGQETDKYGYATEDAVKRFQTLYGLPVTGRISMMDRLMIAIACRSIENKQSPAPTADPGLVLEATVTPVSLTFDVSENKDQQILLEVQKYIPASVATKFISNVIVSGSVPTTTPNILAAVTPNGQGKFVFTVYSQNYKKASFTERILTLTHEVAHLQALSSENHVFSTECSTYIDINGNCYATSSAMNTFYSLFWKGLPDNQQYTDSRFVTPYAAVNPSEDFAESFAFATLREIYPWASLSPVRLIPGNLLDQKLNLFNYLPNMQDLKREILSVLR